MALGWALPKLVKAGRPALLFSFELNRGKGVRLRLFGNGTFGVFLYLWFCFVFSESIILQASSSARVGEVGAKWARSRVMRVFCWFVGWVVDGDSKQ